MSDSPPGGPIQSGWGLLTSTKAMSFVSVSLAKSLNLCSTSAHALREEERSVHVAVPRRVAGRDGTYEGEMYCVTGWVDTGWQAGCQWVPCCATAAVLTGGWTLWGSVENQDLPRLMPEVTGRLKKVFKNNSNSCTCRSCFLSRPWHVIFSAPIGVRRTK